MLTSWLKQKILAYLRSAFPTHKNLFSDGLGTLIVYFLYSTVIILCLPLILANPWFCLIDFSNSGQVGDTIGGVMGPFIALIAAFLTFLAFWIQYRANERQNFIAKEQLKLAFQQNKMLSTQTRIARNQEQKYAIEKFENTLNQMLDVYSKNSEAVKAGNFSGKEAFEEMATELVFIYRVLDGIISYLIRTKDYKKITDDEQKKSANLYLLELDRNKNKKRIFLMNLSYALFFTGFFIKDKESILTDPIGPIIENELYWRINNMEYVKDSTCTYKSKLLNENEISISTYRAPYKMAKGHDNVLGHYYRQMLQIVKFISEGSSRMFTEKQKYEYVKLLRSQMCNSEQVLFYYNSTSVWGKAWREKHRYNIEDVSTWGYIIRFRLIKNIPSNFPFVGFNPNQYYNDDINKWEAKYGKNFFETDLFGLNGSDL